MSSLIMLVVWIVIVLLVAGAVLGVVKAVLALEMFNEVRPFANVIYALVVLLVILIVVSMFYGGGRTLNLPKF